MTQFPFIIRAGSNQKTIEGYENSPKTINVFNHNHNRGSSARTSRQIKAFSPPVPSRPFLASSQPYPVMSEPEIQYGFKPMISQQEELERDSFPGGPTEATLEDFPIPDIGLQLQTLYRPIWNNKDSAVENQSNRFQPSLEPVSRPKKSPFHPYVAPYADPALSSGSISSFYPNHPTSHLLIEDNPNYSNPKSEHDSTQFLPPSNFESSSKRIFESGIRQQPPVLPRVRYCQRNSRR